MLVVVCFTAVSIGVRTVVGLRNWLVVALFFIYVNVYLLFFRFVAIPRTVSMASCTVTIIWLNFMAASITFMSTTGMTDLVTTISSMVA